MSALKTVLIVDGDTLNTSRTRRRIRSLFPKPERASACTVCLSTAEEAVLFIWRHPNASYFLIVDLSQHCRAVFNAKSGKLIEIHDGISLAYYAHAFMSAKIYQSIVFARDGQCLDCERAKNFLFIKGSVADRENWPPIKALLSTFLSEPGVHLDCVQAPP